MYLIKKVYYNGEPWLQIIFNKPMERFMDDLKELPLEIARNTTIKY